MLCLQSLKWRLRWVLEWTYKFDKIIWVTYYGFACHLQVVVDLNRESCILERIIWRFQLPKGVLPISLLQHGIYTSMNPWYYVSTQWEGLDCRLCITDDVCAPSCDQSKIVKSFPTGVSFVSDLCLKKSGTHVEWVLYGSCVWNRIQRLFHGEAVAWYWQILTGIRLYCTVSTSFRFLPLVCRFLAIQYEKILNSNGSYSTYNFQSSIMIYGLLRILKLPVC